MPVYSTSSLFISTAQDKDIDIRRVFTIGNSDYSDYVKSWPKISRRWNDIRPKKASISLLNQEKTFNFFLTDPTKLKEDCEVRLGINFSPVSNEDILVFGGTIGKVSYTRNGTEVSISLVDKLKPFSEKVVGSSDVPVDFTTSNYHPSDLAWWLVSSYGGLDGVKSSSNVDIDYQSWSDWHDLFVDDSVVVNALFDGQKITECLRKIGRITGSSIFEENGKISFTRFSTSSAAAFSVTSDSNFSIRLSVDEENVVNKQIVNADYDVTSKYYKIVVEDESTYSVNSYGAKEQVEKDSKIWYVNSAAALNYAQRSVDVNKDPKQLYRLDTGMQMIARAVGETISITADTLDLSDDTFRIMGYNLNVDKCTFSADIDASQLRTFFILDDAVLGLLDQATNPLG